jgi:hypothetical protein
MINNEYLRILVPNVLLNRQLFTPKKLDVKGMIEYRRLVIGSLVFFWLKESHSVYTTRHHISKGKISKLVDNYCQYQVEIN